MRQKHCGSTTSALSLSLLNQSKRSCIWARGWQVISLGISVIIPLTTVIGTAYAQSNSVAFVPVITTYAGSGSAGNTGNGGPALQAKIQKPAAVGYDSAGNLYICDSNKSVLREVTASTGIINGVAGTGTSGYNGDNIQASTAELNQPTGVAVDAAGNIYIADASNNRVRKITASTGIITTFAGNGTAGYSGNNVPVDGSVTTVELNSPAGVSVDQYGNVFIADTGNNRVREVVASTATKTTAPLIVTIAGTGTATDTGDGGLATAATLDAPHSVAPDASGNIYVDDWKDKVVREILANGNIKTVAGTDGIAGVTGDGGPATSATLDTPESVAVDAAGNLYIVDDTAQTVREVNAQTQIIYSIAGAPSTPGYAGDKGLSTAAELSGPFGIAMGPFGTLAIADTINKVVRQLQFGNSFPATNVASPSTTAADGILAFQAATVNSPVISPAALTDFSLGTVTGCTLPGALAAAHVCALPVTFTPAAPGVRTSELLTTDSKSNKYILGLSGVGNAAAVAFTPGIISTYAGTGTVGSTGDGSAATLATITMPSGAALDAAGDFYLAGSDNKVRMVAATTGVITTVAGTGTPAYTGDGAVATSATLNKPAGLAVDPSGNLYIADSNNSVVRMVSSQTGFISTVPATAGQLNKARGVAADATGNLYIADTGNHALRRIAQGTGYMTTLAGTVGTSGYGGDGSAATSATLNSPAGVAVDSSGNLYIADTGNNVIRKITSSTGIITTVAGTGTAAGTGDGGLATAATLSGPTRVAVDAAGDLYIADAGNNRIRFVSAASGIISTIAGSGSAAYTGDGGPATSATFNAPGDIVLDPYANFYVADTANSRIALIGGATTTVSFGTLNPGATSSVKVVTVVNFGNLPLTLSALTFNLGTGSVFAHVAIGSSDCSSTTVLNAGASCQIGLQFAPIGGGNYTGSVVLTDNALNAAAATQTINLAGTGINNPPVSITVSAGNNQTVTPYANFATLQAKVVDVNNYGVSGAQVTFTASGAAATFANGTNTATVPTVAGGLANATLFTAGGADGGVSVVAAAAGLTPTATFSETIAGLPSPTITVSYSPVTNPQTYGNSITVNATLAPTTLGGKTQTGTVSFFDNGGSSPVGTGNVAGSAASAAYSPMAGSHSITATYSGDSNFSSTTTAVPAMLTVNPLGITAAGNSISIPYGTAPPALTGSLQGVLTQDQANLSATFTSSATVSSSVGIYPMSATLSGSAMPNYTIATTIGSVTITPAITATTLTAPTLAPGIGEAINYSVALTAATGGTPGGSVNFYVDGALVSTKNLSNGGKTQLSWTFTTLGAHTLYAVYIGTTNFAASTSTTLAINVVTPDFTFTSASATTLTVTQGQDAVDEFSYAVVGGFSGTLTFTCSGLPASATCIFTPPTFTPGTVLGGTGLMVIHTAGNSIVENRSVPSPHNQRILPMLAGLLLLPGLLFGAYLSAGSKRRSVLQLLGIALVVLCLASGITGCGSGVANPISSVSTPLGTSTITVTATSGSDVHTFTLALTVISPQ